MSFKSEDTRDMREEAMNIAFRLSDEKVKQQIQHKKFVSDISDGSLPDQRCNNINLAKIIWKIKLKTTILHNVINQIINKWPEDRVSFLDIIEKNKNKYEVSPPKELFDLVDTQNVNFEQINKNSSFEIGETPYPSRVQYSKRGLK